MPRRRSRLAQWLMATLSIGFGLIAGWLPLRFGTAIGRRLGSAAYYLVPRIRRTGLANLDLAYGDALSPRDKVRILKRATENVGIVVAEMAHIPRVFPGHTDEVVTLEGFEQIDKTRGAVAVSAHLGNWEWLAPAAASHGFKLAGVVRPLRQPKLDAFVDRTRRAGNILTIPKDQAGPEVVRLLGEGYIVGLLIDQNPRRNATRARFFGRETWATIGPALAAARARVPVYAVSMIRGGGGRYTLRLESEIPMARTGDLRSDLAENTQRCQDAIEKLVRAHPEQWLWLHRRWKPRPHLESGNTRDGSA